jgi:N-acetylglutamate synthase-like GNAT family acetyltransferase
MSELGTVRLARPEDGAAIYALLETMNTETGVFNFDTPLVQNIIERLTIDRSAGIIGVIEGEAGVVATVGLSVMPSAWYTRDNTLYELWSFVHPQHRSSSHAKNLILFSKQCAELVSNAGNPMSFMSIVKVGEETRKKMGLYSRQAAQLGTFSLYLYNPLKQYTRIKHRRGGQRNKLVEVA